MSSHAAAVRRTSALGTLWRFSRPHTLIGTFVSAAGLYAIAVHELPRAGLGDLCWVIVAGAGVNLAIVGVNQITDVEIDRVNKPHLPIAAGELTREAAWRIVLVAALLPLVLALTQGLFETAAVVVGARGRRRLLDAAGAPQALAVRRRPVHLRGALGRRQPRHVRALRAGVRRRADISPPVWALTAFVLPFSFAIAVLKDVPDIEGDRRYRIATFTVRLGPRRAARLGIGALVLAYAGMVDPRAAARQRRRASGAGGGHVAALGLLLTWARRADPADPGGFTVLHARLGALLPGVVPGPAGSALPADNQWTFP